MRNFLLLNLLLVASVFSLSAQDTKFKVEIAAGYELPERAALHSEENVPTGYNVSLDMKYYLIPRLYAMGTIYTNKLKGEQPCIIHSGGDELNGIEHIKSHNIFVGLGLGFDFLRINKHTAFVQASYGLCVENYETEKMHGNISYSAEQKTMADWGIVGKIGYSYRINQWLGVGASYGLNYLNWTFSQGFQGGFQLYF